MLNYSADSTYSFEDLLQWDFPGTSLAVLGQPVRHSISPQMHNAALAEMSRARPDLADWKYFRFEIDPEQLLEALPLFHKKGFAGLNLTVPHKEIAFPSAVEIDPDAQPIGAVNTLLHRPDGYAGFNTDGYGLSQGIRIDLESDFKGSHIVLLGAGGAARAAAIQALTSNCKSLSIVNRNQDRLGRLLSELQPIALDKGAQLKGLAPDTEESLPEHCILVNATSLGLKPNDPTPIPKAKLPHNCSCYDMIYNPPQTELLRLVSKSGGRVGNGLSMLVHQGAKSLQIWTKLSPPADTMLKAAQAALATAH